ncbi:MAG: peptide deformylase, partial [Patescibacteria group bacterium]
LSTSAVPIKTIDKRILKLFEDMKDTLKACIDPVGVGLAAPQVGYGVQLFIVKHPRSAPIEVFINPKVLVVSDKTAVDSDVLEGCLSVLNLWGHVERATSIEMEFQKVDGSFTKQKFTGYKAHIIQHELDHLRGVLFTQRVIEQSSELFKVEIVKGKEKFVPVEV